MCSNYSKIPWITILIWYEKWKSWSWNISVCLWQTCNAVTLSRSIFLQEVFSRNHSSRNVNRRSVRLNNCKTLRLSSIYPNYFVKRSFKKVNNLMKKMFFFSFFELRRHNWPRIIVFSWFLSLMTYCTRVRNHMIKYRW